MITKTLQQLTSKQSITTSTTSIIKIITGQLVRNSQQYHSFSTCRSSTTTNFLNTTNIQQFSNQITFNYANSTTKSLVSKRQKFSSSALIRNQTNNNNNATTTSPEPPTNLDPYEKKLYEILTNEFAPEFLDVRDVSGGCGSMFYINIVSDKFNGLPLVKQHQAVNQALKEEIPKWHGLQLRTRALDKFNKK